MEYFSRKSFGSKILAVGENAKLLIPDNLARFFSNFFDLDRLPRSGSVPALTSSSLAVILMSSQTSHNSRPMPKSLKKSNREVSPVPKPTAESWQIQSAKARFSEVFRKARTEGPQRITRQGKEGVVMVAEEQYEQLVGKSRQPKNIVDFFRQSPLVGLELDLKRDRSPARDVDI